jgi:hypothetical protein
MPRTGTLTLALIALTFAQPVHGQTPSARAEDVGTIEGVMTALYATVTKDPGQNFDWPRLRTLFLPEAIMVPSVAQVRQGRAVHTPESFITWIDGSWAGIAPNSPQDQGFFERQVGLTTHTYGDVAIAFSVYEKGYKKTNQVIGRGINALQLVKRNNRWFIVGIAWDEENTAGPVPAEFLGTGHHH